MSTVTLPDYFDTADIGGVSSAFMYLGTRAWYAEGDASTLHTDNFFKGNIDEFRIWDLYRNETLIRDNDNVKLDGNQMGLLAYYPFEYYKEFQGKQELDFTLADMKVQTFPENKVPDATSNRQHTVNRYSTGKRSGARIRPGLRLCGQQ